VCSTTQSHDHLANDVIVIEEPSNPKAATLAIFHCACHLADALNSELFIPVTRGRNENFDSNVTPNGRASCAKDESAIYCNVVCEATFCVLPRIIPMKDHRQREPVPNCGPPLRCSLNDR